MQSLLKNEKPDGYTIGALATGPVAAQYLRKDVPYDIIKDFTPVIGVSDSQYGLAVRADAPWKTFKEFIDYAKSNPGKIRYSTAGPGGPQHLVMERLAEVEKIKWIHVPFEGAIPANTALLGGHVEANSSSSEWKKQVEAGRQRLLAVYEANRNSDFPDVPTLKELGYDITALTIAAIMGPKGMDPLIVKKLHDAFKVAAATEIFKKTIRDAGMAPHYRSTEELSKFLPWLNEEMRSAIGKLDLQKR
jgi:tripartite-type tricarboxylate transporter receptor subunit TctC